ncbi:MAG: Tol-Pal system beta propeller repeat protein TolB [Deltaproteobacteria bacterium]|nr:Tol-Pal system beta propeller repeat protein TolB [Deltaproteobacteria bacterium]
MKSNLTLMTLLSSRFVFYLFIWALALCVCVGFYDKQAEGKLYVDITSPSMRRIPIAVPDFKYIGADNQSPELASTLAHILSNDFDISGYFNPLEKESFIEAPGSGITHDSIIFKDWSLIGAELLLKAGYECIGKQLKVEARLFDVFSGRQLYGKRALGPINQSRQLMHRLANDVIFTLTGHKGPFSTQIAFSGTATGNKEIYISDFDGHNLRQITNHNSISISPRLSLSGERMLYTTFLDSATVLLMRDLAQGSVTKLSDKKGLNIAAAWRPGEEEVALTLTTSGNPDIYTISLEGKPLQRLTTNWGIDVSPAFSPDGKKMAFVSNRSGSPQIYILDIKNNSVERLTYQGNYNTSPAWSKLDRIAFSGSADGNFDLFTIQPDGGGLQRLTQDQGDNEDPCWSPGGRYIAFSSNRGGGKYHIFIANANGDNQRQITFSEGEQFSPSWAYIKE